MSVPKKRNRLFAGLIMSLMCVLALYTVVLAQDGDSVGSGSYSLIIQKQFATVIEKQDENGNVISENVPDAVLEEAKKQTYTFKIEGYYKERADNGELIEVPYTDTVTINGDSTDWEPGQEENGVQYWKQSKSYHFEGPFNFSVTEVTNNITLKVNGEEYNMGDSKSETTNTFTESPQIRNLNSNGKLTLSRPAKKYISENGELTERPVTTTSYFRIQSKWMYDESQKPGNWKRFDKTVELKPGATYGYTGLSAGQYTIEDLSIAGYNLQIESRNVRVDAGKTGSFYINGGPGNLTITAGGDQGDGETHYYTIERINAPQDALPFETRTVKAGSGEPCVVDDLPRGEYKVSEYTVSAAPTKFTVKVPQTETEDKSWNFIDFTKQGVSPISRYYIDMGGDYVTNFRYGPIYDENGKMLSETDIYTVRYIANWIQEDGTTKREGFIGLDRKGNYYYTLKTAIEPGAGNQRLAFGVGETPANKGGYCLLKWTENTRKEPSTTKESSNTNYSLRVDDRGWIEITAPEISDEVMKENVTYTYEVRKSKEGTALASLDLEPGKTGTIEDLDAGSYLLMETVNIDKPKGFTMDVSGAPCGGEFGKTEAGYTYDITVMGDRTLTITKPGTTAQDGGRIYTFEVKQTEIGNGGRKFETKTIELKAGETNNPITLPAGKYKVTALDDKQEIFGLLCSDSSQVQASVPSQGESSTITFTNVFTPGNLGYRYVHEYYRKDKDGHYHFEGNSPVTTVGGRTEANETYSSIDITKEPTYAFIDEDGDLHAAEYTYMPGEDAYGYVISQAHHEHNRHEENQYGIRQCGRSASKGNANEAVLYELDHMLTNQHYIGVTENKEQIIILRYYRELPEDQMGSYNFVHVYYRRDNEGDHWEGTSEIKNVSWQLGMRVPGDSVTQEPQFKPKNSEETYTYKFDQRPNYGTLLDKGDSSPGGVWIDQDSTSPDTFHGSGDKYRPNSEADYIVADAEGKQIIILRYYREVDPAIPDGEYKIVHEYYYRAKREDSGVEEGDSEVEGEEQSLEMQSDEFADDFAVDDGGGGDEEFGSVKPEEEIFQSYEPMEVSDADTITVQVPEESGGEPEGAAVTEAPVLEASENPLTVGANAEPPVLEPSEMPPVLGAREGTPIENADETPLGTEAPVLDAVPQVQEDSQVLEAVPPVQDAMPPVLDAVPQIGEAVPSAAGTETQPAVDESREPEETEETLPEPVEDEPSDIEAYSEEYDAEIELFAEGEEPTFAGTLSSDETHDYIFEGNSDIETVTAPLTSTHYGDDVEKQPDFGEHEYTYLDVVYGTSDNAENYSCDPNMEWVASTEEGTEIIILRYYRDEDEPPEEPDTPPEEPDNPPEEPDDPPRKPKDPPKDPDDPPKDPDDPPKDPETPPEEPETPPETPETPETPENPETPPEEPETPPETPEYPSELPDPNDPNSPEEITIIGPNGVPLTYIKFWDPEKEEWVYLPEDEIPLAPMDGTPQTGDEAQPVLWGVLCAASLGAVWAMLPRNRKKRSIRRNRQR